MTVWRQGCQLLRATHNHAITAPVHDTQNHIRVVADIWRALLDKGFVLNLTQGTVLRLLPPLVITQRELEGFARALDEILSGRADSPASPE